MHVAYPQQGHTAGSAGEEVALCCRIPLSAEREGSAGDAGHCTEEIPYDNTDKRMLLARA